MCPKKQATIFTVFLGSPRVTIKQKTKIGSGKINSSALRTFPDDFSGCAAVGSVALGSSEHSALFQKRNVLYCAAAHVTLPGIVLTIE